MVTARVNPLSCAGSSSPTVPDSVVIGGISATTPAAMASVSSCWDCSRLSAAVVTRTAVGSRANSAAVEVMAAATAGPLVEAASRASVTVACPLGACSVAPKPSLMTTPPLRKPNRMSRARSDSLS